MSAVLIPGEELDRFLACSGEAWELASRGCERDGFTVLDLALTWAETRELDPVTGETRAGEPWRDALIARYRCELERYITQYRAALGEATLCRRVSLLRDDARELRETAQSLRTRSEQLRRRAADLVAHGDELARRLRGVR